MRTEFVFDNIKRLTKQNVHWSRLEYRQRNFYTDSYSFHKKNQAYSKILHFSLWPSQWWQCMYIFLCSILNMVITQVPAQHFIQAPHKCLSPHSNMIIILSLPSKWYLINRQWLLHITLKHAWMQRDEVFQKKYLVSVQWSQSYLMGRCLFSLTWTPF